MSAATERKVPMILHVDGLLDWFMWEAPVIDDWTADEIANAMYQVGRNEAPLFLEGLGDTMSRDHFVALVGPAWSGCEYPSACLDDDTWRWLFRMAGYTRTGEEDLGQRWPRRRKPMRLYRGAHEGWEDGWSWTTDLEMARWFAARDRGLGTGKVWTTVVEPHNLLAQIDARKEYEYVVDPETLGDLVEICEEAAA